MAADKSTLEVLDQRRIAVKLLVLGREHLVIGRGIYEREGERRLRIELPPTAGFELVLLEESWAGAILPGVEYDCDYLIRIA